MRKTGILSLAILFGIMFLLISCTQAPKTIESSNGAICDNIKENIILSNYYYSTECYQTFAIFKKDSTFCKKISDDPVQQTDCILKSIGTSSSTDNSLCETLPPAANGRDQCYWIVAKSKQDSSFCSNIETSGYKRLCLESANLAQQDSSFCENKAAGEREDCYWRYASVKKDISFCDKITNSDFNKDTCYFEIGISNSNFNICPKIKDLKKRNDCYISVAIFFEDASKCNYLSSCSSFMDCELQSKEYCYFIIGGATKDLSICGSIDEDERAKELCYTSISLSDGNPTICDKIESTEGKERCLKYLQ